MPLALCQYAGSGTRADPFRPSGVEGMEDWSSLDLRSDATQPAGFCVVWHETDVPVGAVRVLGSRGTDNLTPAVKAILTNRLGLNLTMATLGDILGEILTRHPNWQPTRGRHQVFCGREEPWFDVPAIAGGAALATDDFNRADANPISGNWTGFTGETNFQITSNAAAVGNGLSDNGCYENTATWPNDQYSQAKATCTSTFNDGSGVGVRVRMSTSARTAYDAIVDASGHVFFSKFVSGSYTNVWSRTVTYAAGNVIYIEAQGTTIVVKYNGSAVGASSTDSSIASGKAGLRHSGNTNSNTRLDDWEGGNFGGSTTNQSLNVTSTTVPKVVKNVAKNVAAATTTVPLVRKSVGKIQQVTSTTVLSLVKSVAKLVTATSTTAASMTQTKARNQALSATTTTAAAMVRQVGKLLTSTSSTSSTIVKSVAKALSATSSTVASLSALKAFNVALSVTTTTAAAMSRVLAYARSLSVTSTTTSTMMRSIGKGLSVTSTSAASVVKSVGKVLHATSATVASLGALKAFNVAMSVTSTAAATMRRQVGKALAATSSTVPGITKGLSLALAVTSTTVSSVWKGLSVSLSANSALTTTLQAVYQAAGNFYTTIETLAYRVVGRERRGGGGGDETQGGASGPRESR